MDMTYHTLLCMNANEHMHVFRSQTVYVQFACIAVIGEHTI